MSLGGCQGGGLDHADDATAPSDFRRVEQPILQDKPGEGEVRREGEKSKAVRSRLYLQVLGDVADKRSLLVEHGHQGMLPLIVIVVGVTWAFVLISFSFEHAALLDQRQAVCQDLRRVDQGAGIVGPSPKVQSTEPRLSQNTGDPDAVEMVKQRFGLEEHGGQATWGPTV